MKTLMICGSPRITGSNSLYLLKALKEKLGNQNDIIIYETSKNDHQEVLQKIATDILECDIIVVSFPLYVDSIPSNLLSVLQGIEQKTTHQENITVYQIVNNGFYDALQNHIAIDMIWNWCDKCKMKKGRALGVGAGGMSQAAPLGKGPSTNLGKDLNQLAADILAKSSGDTVYTEPNFPRFLYKIAAHMGWRKQATKNGLKVNVLRQM